MIYIMAKYCVMDNQIHILSILVQEADSDKIHFHSLLPSCEYGIAFSRSSSARSTQSGKEHSTSGK